MTKSIDKGLHLHFDPCSGLAGDMTVGALVDAGVPESVVVDAIRAMGLKGLKVSFEPRRRGAFVGLGFVVDWPGKRPETEQKQEKKHDHGHDHDDDHGHGHDDEHGHGHDDGHGHGHDDGHGHGHGHDDGHGHGHSNAHAHRDYAEIRRLLRDGRITPTTRKLATAIFDRIAHAEAALHGVSVAKVTFHEVGAWDSIADIVGAAAALAWLEPASITSAPPAVGTGTIRTAHGLMPVPAPATAAILRGVPVLNEGKGELTTPTGAAILATVVQSFAPPPPMRLHAQGFGAGTREMVDRPNVLRVLLGEALGTSLPAAAEQVVQLDANIDDMNPQLAEPLMTALFAAGAVDVWFTPIVMKKGRPAFEVSALGPPDAVVAIENAFFLHSTTLGVRRLAMDRTVLDRAMTKVATPYGDIRVKLASRDGATLGATPEFDDCRKLALRAEVPVRLVMAEANAKALLLLRPGRRKRS